MLKLPYITNQHRSCSIMPRKIFIALLMLILLSLNSSCWSSHGVSPQYLWQDKEEIAKVRQDQPSAYYKNKKSIVHLAEKVAKQPFRLDHILDNHHTLNN